MKKEVEYELKSGELEYGRGGDLTSSGFITLTAPTSKNLVECAQLKQAFFRALNSQRGESEAEKKEDDPDVEINGELVMNMIAMSSDTELAEVLLTAKKLLTSGVAKVGGEEKLTVPLIDQLSLEDLEGLVGTYLVNFILASVLETLKKALSKSASK